MILFNILGDVPKTLDGSHWKMSGLEAITFSMLAGFILIVFAYKKLKSNGSTK